MKNLNDFFRGIIWTVTFNQPYQIVYDGCVVTHLIPVPVNMNAQEISTLRLRPVNQKRSSCQQHSSRRRQNMRFFSYRLFRLFSATFEQLLAFGATFCGFSNLEQVLPFRAIFEQNIGLEHISSTKKSTISWKTSIHANFLNGFRLWECN